MFKQTALFAACLTTGIVATGLAMPSVAHAKDWIEKVEVKRDGINPKSIYVAANGNGYTQIKTTSYTFPLRLYAKAKSGKRIVAMKLGSFKGVRYFEADGSLWSKSFANRDVGSGSKRTVSLNYNAKLPLHAIKWDGSDPKKRCALRMQYLMGKGQSKQQVLSKQQSVKAYAYFELDAVAARKNKAKKGWKLSNTSSQRDSYKYEVHVTCGASTGLSKK